MAHTACLVCPVSTIIGCHKNPSKEQALIAGAKTKLEESIFIRYLWPTGAPCLLLGRGMGLCREPLLKGNGLIRLTSLY
jgi:hypothetical protein